MELEDHAGKGHDALMAARDTLLELAGKNPLLTRVRHNGLDDSPQLQVDIDQRKAQALGVSIDDINDTLQTAWGSSYVNDFMDRGRVKKVYVQAAAKYRMLPDDINLWYVRNSSGTMVPFSAFATSRWEVSSPRLERYNGYSAVEIVGEAAPGISTGTAMDMMEKLAAQLPTGFGLEWTAMSYQERLSGAQALTLYAISLLVVFLCLAALYESWSVPFSVMLVVPLGVIGALLATWMRGLENDVYFQVGLLTVIGLSAKNAILIVEFANELNEKGQDLLSATLSACRQRLRPILMTSLAFIFGVLPMATSTDAWLRQPACGRHRSDGRDDLRHRAGDLFRAAVLCAGASPFSAKGASAINRRASAARRNNRKGDHGGRLLYVFRTLARLFTSRYSPAHIAEIYLRSMPSIKSFQFPSSCSIIIASLIIMVDSI